jgi:hypothetical protein
VPAAPFADGGLPAASGRFRFSAADYGGCGLQFALRIVVVHAGTHRAMLTHVDLAASAFLPQVAFRRHSQAVQCEPLLESQLLEAAARGFVDNTIARTFMIGAKIAAASPFPIAPGPVSRSV